jgi:hypothetical protein
MLHLPVGDKVNKGDAVAFGIIDGGEGGGKCCDHGVVLPWPMALAIRPKCLVNLGEKGSDFGCVIGIECKQVVEGCRLDIDSRVQLIELGRRNGLCWGLQAGRSRGFAVNPALGGGPQGLEGPPGFQANIPVTGVGPGASERDFGRRFANRNLHSHNGAGMVGVRNFGNNGVVCNGED